MIIGNDFIISPFFQHLEKFCLTPKKNFVPLHFGLEILSARLIILNSNAKVPINNCYGYLLDVVVLTKERPL